MEDLTRDMAELRGAIAALDEKMDRRFDRVEGRFYWVIGIQFTILISIMGGLFGVITKLL